jgi:hypothetical protein
MLFIHLAVKRSFRSLKGLGQAARERLADFSSKGFCHRQD